MFIGRFVAALLAAAAATVAPAATTLYCTTNGVPVLLRAEGIAEPVGDIVLACTGTPGAAVSANLGIFLSVNITNRIGANDVTDAVLTVDTGSGPVSTGATPLLLGPNSIAFTGMSFTLGTSGTANLRVTNLRALPGAPSAGFPAPVQAFLSWSGTDAVLSQTTLDVGVPYTGLLAGIASTIVNCQGSRLPPLLSVTNLLGGGTALTTTRVTEGFAAAFSPRQPGSDSGVRFVLEYTGFPAGSRLFAPDAVAGTSAAQPTTSGLLGGSSSPGQYAPGSGTLLLVRVDGAGANGAGGTLAYTPGAPGSGPAVLDTVSELALKDGAATAVYEVEDANPVQVESAEIPAWLGLDPTGGLSATTRQSVTFGPVSDVTAASASAPIPRFLAIAPPADCSVRGDCGVFPKLSVTRSSLEFTGAAGSGGSNDWVYVKNTGGGYLGFSATVTYKAGSDWIALVENPVRNGAGGVNVRVKPQALQPGVYEATLTIDAGEAGLANVPVTFTVTAAPAPPPTVVVPQVTAVLNAATFASGPVVPGSLTTLMGSHLEGGAVGVTFDSNAATLLYTGDSQINLLVPAELRGHETATLSVVVDGVASAPQTVNVAAMSPGIFGILNQDSTLNDPSNPEAGGRIIQVFGTGLPAAADGAITAKIHDVWIPVPEYAGPAPGLPGVQQVNLRVPEGWPPMSTSVVVCGTSAVTGDRVCSPQAPFTVK